LNHAGRAAFEQHVAALQEIVARARFTGPAQPEFPILRTADPEDG
jgi:hypothetical protein